MRPYALVLSPIVLFFVLLFLFVRFAPAIPLNINSVSTTKSDTFSVTGESKVNITPDIATVNLGVTANGTSVKAAQDTLNSNINKVNTAIKALGVAEADLQTTNYNITPNYDFQSGTQRITGYSASSSVVVKVRNMDNVNAIVDAATGSGANQVNGISFDVEDRTKAEDEARKLAVEDARKKAEQAANIANFRLGRLVNYYESFAGGGTPIPYAVSQVEDARSTNQATQVEPGSTEITLHVTLSYTVE